MLFRTFECAPSPSQSQLGCPCPVAPWLARVKLTSNKVLCQDGSLVLRHIHPGIDLKRCADLLEHQGVTRAVRLKGTVPLDLDPALLHILDEQAFYHSLVYEQDIRVQHIDDGRVVDLTAQPPEGLVGCRAPEGDVVDAHAPLQ